MGNSKAIGIRIEEDKLGLIQKRAERRGWSFNKWVNWAISQGLRQHKANNQKTVGIK